MACGKSTKRQVKVGKKGGKKKKDLDPMLRKDWYKLVAPAAFHKRRDFGVTCVGPQAQKMRKSQEQKLDKLPSEKLKDRIFVANLADLNDPVDEDAAHRKIKLICEDVQGKSCLTDFHGMDMTRDKICNLIHKWHTLIEASTNAKTKDGYFLRLFCIGFTKKREGHLKTTCYAKTTTVKKIRKKMREMLVTEAKGKTLNELVHDFIPEVIGTKIADKYRCIFPIENVYVRKVKVLKRKFDLERLMANHKGEAGKDGGKATKLKESEGAQNILSAQVQSHK
eukprot:Selendium_serpulae@DN3424_c0_g1_i1.p1